MSRWPHDKQHASYGRLDGDISAQAKSKVKVKKKQLLVANMQDKEP